MAKLFPLYQVLAPKSRRRFGKFARSVYHNRHKGVLGLLAFLEQVDLQRAPSISREAIFAVLFPGLPYDNQRLRLIISYLRKLLEQFLIWEELKENPLERKTYLLRALKKLGQMDAYQIELRRSAKENAKRRLRNLDYHAYHLEVLQKQYDLLESRKQPEGALLEQITAGIDLQYIISKLKYGCKILTYRKIFKTSLEMKRMESVEKWVVEQDLIQLPAVGIYYHTYKILKEEEPEAHFQALRQQLEAGTHFFPVAEVRSFYLFAINYCIKNANLGQPHAMRRAFELYRTALAKGVLMTDGVLSPYTYKNIVSSGLKLGEFDWVKDFIDGYTDTLPVENGAAYAQFARARWHFAQGEFEQTLGLLNRFYIREIFTLLDAKVLLLKANYEVGAWQEVESQLDSFQQLVRRKEVLAYHRENYANFGQFLGRLVRLGEWEKGKLAKLRAEIEAELVVVDKGWLLGLG